MWLVQYARCMSTMQVRNVPPELSSELKSRAARRGQSLSDYLLGILQESASRPSREEIIELVTSREKTQLSPAAEQLAIARQERR